MASSVASASAPVATFITAETDGWVTIDSAASLNAALGEVIQRRTLIRMRITRAYRAQLGLDAHTIRDLIARALARRSSRVPAPLLLPEEDLPYDLHAALPNTYKATRAAHDIVVNEWKNGTEADKARWGALQAPLARMLTAAEPARADWQALSALDAGPVVRRALARWVARLLHARLHALVPGGGDTVRITVSPELLGRANAWASELASARDASAATADAADVPELFEALELNARLNKHMTASLLE